MKKAIFLICAICMSTLSYSQARLVLNNDVYMVMDGGVFVVVDNPNANAVATMGTGGNLVSEDEDNKLRWVIGTNTGSYVVPYTSNPATTDIKIPMTMTITGAGTGSGWLDFSCYETSTDGNSPWPSMVTHMNDAATGTMNNSLFVVDRWWLNDAQNYTTKPTVNMMFTYIDAANEIAGTNTISEGNLVAQRFNDGNGTWGVPAGGNYPAWGSVNTTNNTVSGITPPSNEFFAAWVLVDNLSLLDVSLASFEGNCDDGKVLIEWATVAETNNEYFTLERSLDQVNFEVVAEIPGMINSTSVTNYQWTDPEPLSGTSYYRLKQTDINGSASDYFKSVQITACGNEGSVLVYNNGNGEIGLGINSTNDDVLSVELYDMSGRLIYTSNHDITRGYQSLDLKNNVFAYGMYNLRIQGKYTNYNKKVLLK